MKRHSKFYILIIMNQNYVVLGMFSSIFIVFMTMFAANRFLALQIGMKKSDLVFFPF